MTQQTKQDVQDGVYTRMWNPRLQQTTSTENLLMPHPSLPGYIGPVMMHEMGGDLADVGMKGFALRAIRIGRRTDQPFAGDFASIPITQEQMDASGAYDANAGVWAGSDPNQEILRFAAWCRGMLERRGWRSVRQIGTFNIAAEASDLPLDNRPDNPEITRQWSYTVIFNGAVPTELSWQSTFHFEPHPDGHFCAPIPQEDRVPWPGA